MNPFEKINELKLALQQEATTKGVQPGDTISWLEHYQRMLSMLAMVEHELKDAEYNYVTSSLDGSKIKVFDNVTVKQEDLAKGLLVFTPLAVDGEELGSIDMNSLYDILVQLRDSGRIDQDVMVLPPYVAVFKAKLAQPDTLSDADLDADWDAVEEEKAEQMMDEEETEIIEDSDGHRYKWGERNYWNDPD